MSMNNKGMVDGLLISDPILNSFEKDGEERKVCNFCISVRDAKGEKELLNMSIFGANGERMAKYAKKGDYIGVEYHLYNPAKTDENGKVINSVATSYDNFAIKVYGPNHEKAESIAEEQEEVQTQAMAR